MSFANEVRRLKRELAEQNSGPRLLTILGSPEIRKMKNKGLLPESAMGSNREAMVAGDLYAAAPEESTRAFHDRMLRLAKDRGAAWVMLGDRSYNEPPVGSRNQSLSIFG